MNKALIYKYCEVIEDRGNAILFKEEGIPYMVAEFSNGESYSCESLEQFDMLCDMVTDQASDFGQQLATETTHFILAVR